MTAPIALALDGPDRVTVLTWAAAAAPHVAVMKVGLETFLRDGATIVDDVRAAAPACGLFLDLKLHDIPNTVAGAARSIAHLAPDYLTVHASGGPAMVAAAAEALPGTRITAVTVLTSMSEADLDAVGMRGPALDAAVRLARMAVAAGARAIVCSPQEVAAIRAARPGRHHADHPRRPARVRRGQRDGRPVPGGHPRGGAGRREPTSW